MLATILTLALCAQAAQPPPRVLENAFSHNDYRQSRPLFDALDRGFSGVEADVHLRGKELLLGHTGDDVRTGVSLEKFYLEPLLARTRANGGRVHPGGPPGFLLLVDFKSDGEKSWLVLRELLEKYQEMLTKFTPDSIEERAVTLVVSGHRPKDAMRAESVRYAGVDGRLGDLEDPEPTLYPLISDSFTKYFTWRPGEERPFEMGRLKLIVAKAHIRGRKLRFYGVPNREAYWEVLRDGGVDYLNADKLERLRRFLSNRRVRLIDRFSDKLQSLPRNPFHINPQ